MLAQYFNTIRFLRPTQIAARIWFALHKPHLDQRAAPPIRPMTGAYATPFAPARTLVAPEVFRFLNVERRCAAAADWQPQDAAKLWTYNLHYFEDINAGDAATRVADPTLELVPLEQIGRRPTPAQQRFRDDWLGSKTG